MPAAITGAPLGIGCVFSDGATARFGLDGLPNPGLARDLLAGLAELIHPHGTVDTAGSVGHYVQSIRDMTRKLAATGFTGKAGDLRRARLAGYWIGASGPREACTRRMLQAFHAVTGELAADVAELAAGRAFNPQRNHRQLPPYSEAEWDRLVQTCRSIADESYAAHQQALAAAGRGQHPRAGGWTPENLRWLLARLGPVSSTEFGAEVGCTQGAVQQRGGFAQASAEMFPANDTLIAYRLLFGAYSGIVPDGIDDLGTGDIDWAGDATILLSYVKRRTAAESLTLPRRAVRLLEQWLSHSALLRSFAGEQQRCRLWLGLSQPGHYVIGIGSSSARTSIQRWVIRYGVKNDDGGPLKIHRSRIRTTHHAMRDNRTWAGHGRATIDPNHSPHVEGDHYLSAPTGSQRQAIEAIVEDAQHDLLRRAHPPVVVTEEHTAALARDYPQLVSTLELGDTVIAELAGGARDVFVAACADQLSGLHGPKGKPCPARPWVCLLCPLAVFAPRHAPNLLRLKAFFARQWRQMPAAQFMAIFGPYSQRIGQVLDRFDPAVLAHASRQVTGRDDELPLRPEETTQ
ncbi:MAG TPA: hypothetical protein VMV92_09795 [Streptosporangiaceae bacterium]|nr:hypothetical protein [Streptosporangiaceae bacterium]